MHLEGLIEGVFLKRLNRFLAMVELDGVPTPCHVPNSGRLGELLVPGVPARVRPYREGLRTKARLIMVQNRGHWVAVDAHLTNAVAREAVERGVVPGLERVRNLRSEVVHGASRFDMAGTVGGAPCYIEVKCSTLVREGVAYFPDAPTERGSKHLRELITLARQGAVCYVLFLLQHPAATSFAPNAATDPVFADLVGQAIAAGVRVCAVRCVSSAEELTAVQAEIL